VVYTSEYPIISMTVDVVALSARDGALCALMVERGGPPFEGQWALPGGFVEIDEDLATAAARELHEETGVSVRAEDLEQLASYGAPGRDPRGRTVSIAWLTVLDDAPEPRGGSDAAHAAWLPVEQLLGDEALAFDHDLILADAVARSRPRFDQSP